MITKEFETPSHIMRIWPMELTVGLEIDGCPFEIPWEMIDDPEYLANGFGHLLVMDFKPLVEQLGIMYRNRHVYEALMQ